MVESELPWTDIITTPDAAVVSSLVKCCQPFAEDSDLARRRTLARQRVVDASREYLQHLQGTARRAGVHWPDESVIIGDPVTQPIVVTGHQPTIFHAGLTYKYYWTERTAVQQSATGVAVVIDADEGDPGAFHYPTAGTSGGAGETSLQLTQATLCDAPGLYGLVPLSSSGDLVERFELVRAALERLGDGQASERFRSVADEYVKLSDAGVPAAEANLIVRRSQGIGSRLLELPLSVICRFPEALEFTAEILANSRTFAETYNRTLHNYRQAHGISNLANPFPDLQADEGRTELPFWVVDFSAKTRRRLFVGEQDGTVSLFAGDTFLDSCASRRIGEVLLRLGENSIQLIPRAALITSYLRLMLADLFVHGTGGGHYDEFTSEFVRVWWNVQPPPFAVASASQYLFATRRREIQQLQKLNDGLRDLRYNPQRHFGQGAFPEDAEQQLRVLSERKDGIVAQLKTAKAEGISAKDLGHEIQVISDEMRSVVDEAFSSQLSVLKQLTPETEQAVNCRTYPWFLLPGGAGL